MLNHLGRGLYRSFATVVAEAISNSWDAGATEVRISIDSERKILVIEDNGSGMNDDDFRNKFLKVGYSRREDPTNQSGRVVIGRKGIGKLAMLSISNNVKIVSRKKEGNNITGGIVDNSVLDEKIRKDGKYSLGVLGDEEISFKNGTKIEFSDLKERMNSEDVMRKYIATQFNFLFSENSDESFKIIINEREVNEDDLKELNEKTQFIWFLNDINEKVRNRFKKIIKTEVVETPLFDLKMKIGILKYRDS